ncbi:MAG: chemotaxis protein CheW [Nitrospirales bacterium]
MGAAGTMAPVVHGRQVVVVVASGETWFALPADILRGIVRPEEAAARVGGPCPLIDLASRFHLPPSGLSTDSRVLLCGTTDVDQAVRVDQVVGLSDVEDLRIDPLPPQFSGAEREWFLGLFPFRDSIALVVNPDWLLSEGGGLSLARTHVLDLPDSVRSAPELVPLSRGIQPGPLSDSIKPLEGASDADDLPWPQI